MRNNIARGLPLICLLWATTGGYAQDEMAGVDPDDSVIRLDTADEFRDPWSQLRDASDDANRDPGLIQIGRLRQPGVRSFFGLPVALTQEDLRAAAVDIAVIGAPIDADGVQDDALEKLIVEHQPKFVYLIPTFGNPSGATLSLARRKRILELAVRTQTVLIEDDPYGDLYFDTPPPASLLALSAQVPGSRDWLVHCGSLSKVLSPGLRVGWMIAPSGLLSRATMCKQFSDAHTSTFAQATAAQYLKAGRMPATLAHVREVYAGRARTMGECLRRELGDAIAFSQPGGGLFFWARLTGAHGKLKDAGEFARRAIDKGVAFVPGAPFYARQADPSTLRLSFATVGEDRIEEGVTRLRQALQI